ncbi:MAG: alpha/beta hydrolase [Rhodobacteraceae bacterium]|nr:alpha/beta hydrolase [Paracoccaceae bacterium]
MAETINHAAAEGNTPHATSSGIAYEVSGAALESAETVIFWAHGWGQDRRAFQALSASFGRAANVLMDFPGFGAAAPPPEAWDSVAYAEDAAQLVAALRRPGRRVLWVGHSFGGRIGVALAAARPELIDGLGLIAAAGLPRKLSTWERLRRKGRQVMFKTMKQAWTLLGRDVEALKNRYGSADYRNAGAMRPTFLRVINEDLTELARQLQTPTVLVYGADDGETPPEVGRRYAELIPEAELHVFEGQDHYSVLGAGRHLTAKRLLAFLERIDKGTA